MKLTTTGKPFVVLVALLILLLNSPARAQIIYGTFVGTVTDATGALVPNVSITIRNLATGVVIHSVTDSAGQYVSPYINPGTYSVTAELGGFKTGIQPSVKLDIASTVRADFRLEVGSTSQNVTVSGASPLLQTDSTTIGKDITREDLEQLPISNRNFETFATLLPGAAVPAFSPVASYMPMYSTGTYVQVSGQRGSYNQYTYDGVQTNNWLGFQSSGMLPSLDSIAEFKVDTRGDAEYGKGSVQYILSSRSGANAIHGSAYEYHQDQDLNANDFFNNYYGIPKTVSRRNQFGGSVGGPVYVPHIYDGRNKTFLFFGFEGLRIPVTSPAFGLYPPAQWLTGDFSSLTNADGSPRLIYNPYSTTATAAGYANQPFPNNVIPTNMLDPVALASQKYIPAPNLPYSPSATYDTTGTISSNDSSNWWNIRGDQQIGSNNRLFARWTHEGENFPTTSLAPLSGSLLINHSDNAVATDVHQFNARVVNEFRLGFNKDTFGSLQQVTPNNISAAIGLTNLAIPPDSYGLPSFSWGGFSGIGGPVDDPSYYRGSWAEVADNLTIIHGRHSFKTGFDYARYNAFFEAQSFNRGGFSFSGQYTEGFGGTGQPMSSTTGNPFADYLLGLNTDGIGLTGDAEGTFRTGYQGYYFEDNWRATRALTLMLGFRYEYYPPYVGSGGDSAGEVELAFPAGSCFGASCPPANLVIYGPNKPFYSSNHGDVGPRVGLAYTFLKDTVVRSSIGTFYSPSDGTDNGTWGIINPPHAVNIYITPENPYTDLTTAKLSNLFPPISLPQTGGPVDASSPFAGLSTYSELKTMKDPTIYEWQMTVERLLRPNMSVEIGYMGSRNIHGSRRINYNQAELPTPAEVADPSTIPSITSRLPYPSLGAPSFFSEHSASGEYEGGWVRFEKRFSDGLSIDASYTYSKSEDDFGNLNAADAFWPIYAYDKRLEWGLSAIDTPQRFVASYLYDLPYGHGRRYGSNISPVLDKLVGGWQVSGITTFQTGQPLPTSVGYDYTDTGMLAINLRPDIVGPVHYSNIRKDNLFWFNPGAFALPQLGTLGTAARGVLMSPGINNWALNIAKVFTLYENLKLQFRGEFYNAFNHAQFNSVSTSVNVVDPQLGRALGDSGPRVIQLAVRLTF